MELEELRVYQLAMDIGEKVWSLVSNWGFLATDTVGKQLIRSADSIAANISEGYGRYHFKENKRFLFYARGSLRETQTWLTKAGNRNLITEDERQELSSILDQLAPQLNGYIRSVGSVVREETPEYGTYSGNDPFFEETDFIQDTHDK